MKKRVVQLMLSIMLVMGTVLYPANTQNVLAATTVSTEYAGYRIEAQNYSRWASPIQSYLTYNETGSFMRVQAMNNGVLVEYYNDAFQLQDSRIVPAELPIFGGFYETDTNYYLVTGQENPSESASVEVYRITKYDKAWRRIGSAGLYDCNTTVPFDAGSLRMAECGKYLMIRTCHEMYQSSDGLNHQANVTIELDTESMKITDSFTKVMNSGYGYVSHSFNQFIAVENNKIVALDHGDAYPRSIVLIKYQTDLSDGTFVPDYYSQSKVVNVMEFPGAIGQNTTGASVGGFEVAADYYLVAGNSVVQDDSNLSRRTRNVFVAAVDKSTDEVTINWLTNYGEGDGTTSTPHMVKLADNRYAVLWSRNNSVFYVGIDGEGRTLGEVNQLEGNLSDCVPVVAGDKLVWYTLNGSNLTFYDINLSDFDSMLGIKEDYSAVFDAGYYYDSNPDIAAVIGTDTSLLLKHFVDYGMAEGRSASADFVLDAYKANNQDLVAVYGNDNKSYYLHYINYGKAEGRIATVIAEPVDYSAVFDTRYYLEKNPDLRSVLGEDAAVLLNHFIEYGMAEGRCSSPEFDINVYKAKNQDLVGIYGDDNKSYYLHYINYGKAEGRIAIEPVISMDYSAVFDAGYYSQMNQDLYSVIGDDADALLNHFIEYGMDEGRISSPEFDLVVYKEVNLDLVEVYGDDNKSYYLHYINYGREEGRTATRPSHEDNSGISDYSLVFNAQEYADYNEDLKEAYGYDEELLLNHFIEYGMAEGRIASADFNVHTYRAMNLDLQDVYSDDYRAYYQHYVNYGHAEGRVCK